MSESSLVSKELLPVRGWLRFLEEFLFGLPGNNALQRLAIPPLPSASVVSAWEWIPYWEVCVHATCGPRLRPHET